MEVRIVYMYFAKIIKIVPVLAALALTSSGTAQAQGDPASPSNWLYPNGNTQGTRYQFVRSSPQSIDSFKVKWATPSISGDVKPLIGNIINNVKISPKFPFAPNELAAVVQDKLVVVDAAGKTHSMASLPSFVKNVSVLFDTLATNIGYPVTRPIVLGLETVEYENLEDSLAFAYIAGFDADADTVAILKRLAIDLRDYDPNIFGSIRPVLGRKDGADILIYATVNMSRPTVNDPNPATPPYFRGFTQFNTGTLLSTFPLPDVGDDIDSRVTLGPEVNFSQPSFSSVDGTGRIAIPNFPDTTMDITVTNFVTDPTYPDIPYLFSFDLSSSQITEDIYPHSLTNAVDPNGYRPQITPYYIDIKDANTSDSIFILVAEEYRGIEGSHGQPRLHLYNTEGNPLTLASDVTIAPPFKGGRDHLWSVAVGDVDGISTNKWEPYYPNNIGKEIIVTQSSRDFVAPSSKLFVLRYYSGTEVDKPSPPNTYLFHLDTIVSQRINGWVAAVNDLDAASDRKDEIILVDGSKLTVIRLKDYTDYDFRIGRPFDTVYTREFSRQTISSVAVSDIEGDGLNDVIVTTYDSTYVLGTIIDEILTVIEPIDSSDVPTEICAGDTIEIKWINYIRGQDKVNLLFEDFTGGAATGDSVLLEENYENEGDTVSYFYTVSNEVFGKTGRFVVQSSYNPETISDYSTTMTFADISISALPPQKNQYYVSELLEISGFGTCIESASLCVSYGSSTFMECLGGVPVSPSGTFTVAASLPSATFFRCTEPDLDSLVNIHIIGTRRGYADTAAAMPIRLLPAPFPVEWDTCETACPTIEFRWDNMDIKLPCDSVSISLSTDYGDSFTWLTTVPALNDVYKWKIPLGLPDEVMLRFCCENSSVRTDTLLDSYQPTFIDIVAPNPFKPLYEELEIVYEVPEETNVTIRIFDAANRIVAEPVRNLTRLPGAAHCDRWNGLLPNGSPAANGMYYLSLEMSNGIKEVYHVFVRK